MINITHYMDEAARADRVVVINDGEIMLDGTPREIFAKTDVLHSVGLESPQGCELVAMLRQEGVEIPGDPLTEDECTEAILKLLNGSN